MSLSQASSPEEIKRDIKLQVFLAMNNKYSSGQTDRLIEDVSKVTNNIMSGLSSDDCVLGKDGYYLPQQVVGTSAPQEFIESVRNKPMPKRDKPASNDKPFLFIGGRHDGAVRYLSVDGNYKPNKDNVALTLDNVGLTTLETNDRQAGAMTTVYFRHHLTVTTGRWRVTRWFYCGENDISHWTEQKLLSTLDRINKFFVDNMEDPMNNI